MAEGCGMNCIKYLVFIFNFLFAVSILIGWGGDGGEREVYWELKLVDST
jgi:hypothetical protein